MPSDREGPIAGILLAAGLSSRMGSNKLLFEVEVEGETLLRRSARRALAGGLDPLLVVLGHEAERTGRELAGLPCQVVLHPGYEQGITTSVQAGVAALPAGTLAAMVLLADMPHVTPEMISALIARYRSSAAPLVISDYEGVNAPPMLYDRTLFDELLGMTAARCGKQVVKRHRDEAEVLSWPAAALADLDVPEDYERLLAGGSHAR
ncbi:MAG TPA: nucleotidyltransferase family protein [Thermoanaerobaculia bacterium]|nr:nucleotidyltransferase family protein [Thermoanaerobaculia bacterium]